MSTPHKTFAALMTVALWPVAPIAAQENADTQEMVRVSVAGTIVELPVEQAAEACDIDVETLRADRAALLAGQGEPVEGAGSMDSTDAAGGTTSQAEADIANADANAAAAGTGAAETGAQDGVASQTTGTADTETTAGAQGTAGADVETSTDPDATTTNDDVAMASDGTTQGDVGQTDTAAGEISDAAIEAAADPEVPLPTADAVCEIDRERAEELGLPAPD